MKNKNGFGWAGMTIACFGISHRGGDRKIIMGKTLFGLLEGTEYLDKNDPDASAIARGIMARFDQIVPSMQNQQLRDNYGRAIGEHLVEVLGGLIK